MRIDHVAMWVQDLEAMRRFYESLGGRAGALYHNAATGFRSYFVSFGGARLELMQRAGVTSRDEVERLGYAHLALSVGDRPAVDRRAAELRAAGVTIVSGPRQTGDGYYEVVLLDPEGNRVELTA